MDYLSETTLLHEYNFDVPKFIYCDCGEKMEKHHESIVQSVFHCDKCRMVADYHKNDSEIWVLKNITKPNIEDNNIKFEDDIDDDNTLCDDENVETTVEELINFIFEKINKTVEDTRDLLLESIKPLEEDDVSTEEVEEEESKDK